ncbi:MAG: DUF1501 domain-containing protein [Isosphaeraceae bacterium]
MRTETSTSAGWSHPRVSRREALRVGGLGLAGLGLADLFRLEALAKGRAGASPTSVGGSVIYLFQSGGPAQHETFDLKPDAPTTVRGEFRPIDTATPGFSISEHLPRLALRSGKFALVRSFSHSSNDHSLGHHIMLTGYDGMPVGFDPNRPTHNDWPSMAAVTAYAASRQASDVPAAVVLPHLLVHRTGRTIPGQMAGRMDSKHDPMLLSVAPDCPGGYGACPNCFHFEHLDFQHKGGPAAAEFTAPGLDLPQGLSLPRVGRRADLLRSLETIRRGLDARAESASLDRFRAQALSILTSGRTAKAFDVHREDPKTFDRYGRHQFGRSLVLARRLVEAGVRLVQVNLGNNETWDTHQSAFPVLRDKLLPPLDQALSALLDDLETRGLLDRTLIVMGGEFGRTPRISTLPGAKFASATTGACQSIFVAGGGVKGAPSSSASDAIGAYPKTQPYRPSDLAATIYRALGLGPNPEYRDRLDRPFVATSGNPIEPLF